MREHVALWHHANIEASLRSERPCQTRSEEILQGLGTRRLTSFPSMEFRKRASSLVPVNEEIEVIVEATVISTLGEWHPNEGIDHSCPLWHLPMPSDVTGIFTSIGSPSDVRSSRL